MSLSERFIPIAPQATAPVAVAQEHPSAPGTVRPVNRASSSVAAWARNARAVSARNRVLTGAAAWAAIAMVAVSGYPASMPATLVLRVAVLSVIVATGAGTIAALASRNASGKMAEWAVGLGLGLGVLAASAAGHVRELPASVSGLWIGIPGPAIVMAAVFLAALVAMPATEYIRARTGR